MSDAPHAPGEPLGAGGAGTPSGGTPFAVDLARDRRARMVFLVFLAGPLIGLGHFAVVYLVAEAGCTGAGQGLAVFDPPVPDVVTLAATVVAAAGTAATAWWAHGRWRAARHDETGEDGRPTSEGQHDPGGTLAFAGMLLSLLFLVTVLLVGLPAPFLHVC